MKKKIIVLGIVVLVVVVVLVIVAWFIVSNQEGEFSRGRDVPQTGIGGDVLTVEERMEGIRSHIEDWGRDVIVGTPIEFIEGDLDVIPFYHGVYNQIMNSTIYYFQVIDWLWGEPEEDKVIRIGSSAGNIFEIGGEYTLALSLVDLVLESQSYYTVINQLWTLDNSEVSRSVLQAFHEEIRNLPPSDHELRRVINEATPTLEFLEHVDVAMIVTVHEVWEHHSFEGAFAVYVDLGEIVYGELTERLIEHLSRWAVSIRGDFDVDSHHLLLLNSSLMPAARHGSAIPVGSEEYYQFMELLEQANQE